MSERQAKKIRKETANQPAPKKKADKGKVIFNIIAAAIIVAVVALAGYTIWRTVNPPEEVVTLASALEEQGTDFDTAVADWGLDTSVFTPEMSTEEASAEFTLENYAKMSSMETAELLEQCGLPEDTPTNVANKDLPTSVMLKFNGLDVSAEDLREYGLSEDITDDTPWSEAQDEVIEAANAWYSANASTDETGSEE